MSNRSSSPVLLLVIALLATVFAVALPAMEDEPSKTETVTEPHIRQALFVVLDGVYNSELMAPYDVIQHSKFRDPNNYMQTAVVSPDGGSVTSFEGLEIGAHYSFANAPKADILIIPSTEGSMTSDLENAAYIRWIKQAVDEAEWVITVCDGAFPLAATGALDGRVATTFPSDRERLKEMFPKVDVRDDVRMVVDGKMITSVGGGMSYEPAFYLVETVYGREHVDKTAGGLVWPWKLEDVPHLIVEGRFGDSTVER